MGLFSKRSQAAWVDQTPHRFISLNDTIPALEKLDLSPQVELANTQVVLPVMNGEAEYDLTITHVANENAIYLGAKLGQTTELPDGFARDLLFENEALNHAKLAVSQPRGDAALYEIHAINEVRTPFLSQEHLLDEVRSFDAAVTFEFTQVRRLGDKNGVEVTQPELPRGSRGVLGGATQRPLRGHDG